MIYIYIYIYILRLGVKKIRYTISSEINFAKLCKVEDSG